MAKLINLSTLGIGERNPNAFNDPERAYGWNDLLKILEEAPTVDAVEVVRCRECKHKGWVQEPCHGKSIDYCRMWECGLGNLNTTFCSYGERKDGDKL